MKWPEGYKEYLSKNKNVEEKNYIQLNKFIYGLVQAARTWWKTFIEVLKVKLNFKQFANDNCLLTRTTPLGKVMMAIYVDDCLMVGDKDAVKLRNTLTLPTHPILKSLWDVPLRRMARNYCCLNQT